MTTPVTPPPSSPPRGGAPRRAPRTALIAGGALVVGLLIGWLLPSPLGGGGGDASASTLNDQACALVTASFPDGIDEDGPSLLDGPQIHELTAVSGLAQAAAAKDDAYASAGEAGALILTSLQQADIEQLNTALADLREGC